VLRARPPAMLMLAKLGLSASKPQAKEPHESSRGVLSFKGPSTCRDSPASLALLLRECHG